MMVCIKCFVQGSKKKTARAAKLAVIDRSDLELQRKYEAEKKPIRNTIRIATFNTALFAMAPAVPSRAQKESSGQVSDMPTSLKFDPRGKSATFLSQSQMPRSILKRNCAGRSVSFGEQSGSQARLRVTINLPENEISLSRKDSISKYAQEPNDGFYCNVDSEPSHRVPENSIWNRSIYEVLRDVGADLLALQEVKADEEDQMRPLSALADALGMEYVFAESWAPEYGNAVLSKWPIKSYKVQKIADDSDFRNVLKVVIDVPTIGELHFSCTQLDHLNENYRMKQIMSIIGKEPTPHIVAGTLNCLDKTDYSDERWDDISKFNEEKGKPTPKSNVMHFLKEHGHIDAKDFAGEFESVVILASGQEVQGTCKYGTRVDYIFTSPFAPYRFVPGSYEVISSRGTSDHHVVKSEIEVKEPEKPVHHKRTVRIDKASSKCIWKIA